MSRYSAFADYYDILTGNIDYDGLASYLDDLIREYRQEPGGILLDLCCGTGSLSLLFSSLGYDVIGIDNSPDMLSQASLKAAGTGSDILFLSQNAEDIDLFGTVDVTVSTLDSLNHITDPQKIKKVFERVSLFTSPGGLFIFDVNSLYKHRNILADNCFIYDCGKVYCSWKSTLTGADSVKIELDFFEETADGLYKRSSQVITERAYDVDFLLDCAAAAGLTCVDIFEGYTRRPFSDMSERIVFVFRK